MCFWLCLRVRAVLLLLSLSTVVSGGCDFDKEGVRNIKATIDSNPTGFVIKLNLMFPLQCCVFPAAVILLDSWNVLLRNLWEEHLNHSLILDLKQTLDRIIRRNRNTERFQEETDLARFSTSTSSPEELLKLTSELFTRWLEVDCSASMETCSLPTLPPTVERKDFSPSRARLLITRAVGSEEEEEEEGRLRRWWTSPHRPAGSADLTDVTFSISWSFSR
uniref:Uncharacterized protein n=1 Tax=Amphiprion percula TaxID=161767 RepID=A0A3P8SGP8_AMPPE